MEAADKGKTQTVRSEYDQRSERGSSIHGSAGDVRTIVTKLITDVFEAQTNGKLSWLASITHLCPDWNLFICPGGEKEARFCLMLEVNKHN